MTDEELDAAEVLLRARDARDAQRDYVPFDESYGTALAWRLLAEARRARVDCSKDRDGDKHPTFCFCAERYGHNLKRETK